MNYMDIKELKEDGFQGFTKIKDFQKSDLKNLNVIPNTPGISFVLKLDDSEPNFLEENIGGHFKKKNPTVDIETLKDNWVEDTIVIYIGQAGGGKSKATLQKRLKQYMKFGRGEPVGHWGGRYIWQLSNSEELIICWETIIESP